ncbi:hypothetical protein ACEWPN_16395, partial [Yoonia sp. R2-816]
MTKFRGRVASIAPGLSVVATTAVLFTGGAAHAECGDPVGDEDGLGRTVTCDAGNYTDGITHIYTGSDRFTLILDDADIEVGGNGVIVRQNAAGDSDSSFFVQMSDGTVETGTERNFRHGLLGHITHSESSTTATVKMTGGKVTTRGNNALGGYALTEGLGAASVEMEDGTVTTEGERAYGLWAEINNWESTATAKVLMSGGAVTTDKGNAYGIVASSNGSGAVKVEVTDDDSKVTTKGKDAHAVYAWNFYRGNETAMAVVNDKASIKTFGDGAYGVSANHTAYGAAEVYMYNGKVTTEGKEAHGLNAFSASATASVNLNGIVTVSGVDADGIRAESATGFDIHVNGSVKGGKGNGAAIRTISRSGLPGFKREIRINGNAVVNGEESGIAIEDGDGDALVTSAGMITGDIDLGAGDDTLQLNNGSFTGDIRLGAGDDTLELKDGSFTGDIYAGAGNDTVAIHTVTLGEGRYILDGGVGGNDKLTFVGPNDDPINMNSTETHLSNWERVEVDKDLFIDDTSAFHVSGGASDTPTEMTFAGNVTNDGSVALSVQDGATGDVIRINGDYTGSGRNVIALDTVIDGNGATTDRLEIAGDASGEMMLSIAGLDSAGAADAPLVMDVVTVGRASEGTFTLMDGNYVTAD